MPITATDLGFRGGCDDFSATGLVERNEDSLFVGSTGSCLYSSSPVLSTSPSVIFAPKKILIPYLLKFSSEEDLETIRFEKSSKKPRKKRNLLESNFEICPSAEISACTSFCSYFLLHSGRKALFLPESFKLLAKMIPVIALLFSF